ncbi:BZ3500_MvSof-1268-A1-R1_Chr1-3g02069 [Microbotryum saponariae]|uniref:BZ3500_MvSof-1268-A1-R1_Chr1-3g02069 protein n=1 Tax=Microbotryum saponariae TaxID=289078 RepID=A0A2X0KI13_9BASI|nr:BZ3500_MvSof-1268-A1-R1_Chr1-3g02069 [Microbotryum saponariae]SCZ95322.1 BZ3501_MvSof-1269-A2-R1_Chr1-3g01671 [Microbotryum saponariae]
MTHRGVQVLTFIPDGCTWSHRASVDALYNGRGTSSYTAQSVACVAWAGGRGLGASAAAFSGQAKFQKAKRRRQRAGTGTRCPLSLVARTPAVTTSPDYVLVYPTSGRDRADVLTRSYDGRQQSLQRWRSGSVLAAGRDGACAGTDFVHCFSAPRLTGNFGATKNY